LDFFAQQKQLFKEYYISILPTHINQKTYFAQHTKHKPPSGSRKQTVKATKYCQMERQGMIFQVLVHWVAYISSCIE